MEFASGKHKEYDMKVGIYNGTVNSVVKSVVLF